MSTTLQLLALAFARGLSLASPVQEPVVETDQSYASMSYPRFGSVVFTIGDVNRDACRDLVIADPAYGEHPSSDRRLWIVSGVDGKELLAKELAEPATCGSGSGDMNGDGAPDLVISTTHGAQRRLTAYSGRTGATLWSTAVDCTDLEFAEGSETRWDLDGDSASDVLVTLRSKSDGQWRAAVYSGKGGSNLLVARDFPTAARAGAGWVEDADGDRAPDLALACRGENGSGLQVLVVSGRTASVVKKWGIDKAFKGESFALARAPRRGADAGVSYVVAEDTLAAYVTTTGQLVWEAKVEPGNGSAPSMEVLADFDSDGVDDLVLAWPKCDNLPGRVDVRSGRTGERAWMLEGPTGMNCYGTMLATICDRNEDSTPELLVGCDNGILHQPGCVQVVSARYGVPMGRMVRNGNAVVERLEEMR